MDPDIYWYLWRRQGQGNHVCLTLLYYGRVILTAKYPSWGESAGSVSVALQMITNGGRSEGLFHGAFMQSGSPLIVGDITHGQPYYDLIVNEVGCNGTEDTLQCLREAPYEKFQAASSSTPSLFSNTVCDHIFVHVHCSNFLLSP